jgi:hypothetical protein
MTTMRRPLALLLLSIFILAPWATGDEKVPTAPGPAGGSHFSALKHAHAHNDYLHQRPLLDALDHGFCSVEADIFLVDGELLVGHVRSDLRSDRTFEALYLDPLLGRVREQGGQVFADGPGVTLMVDIKTDGDDTYEALDRVLAKYEEMLTAVRLGEVEEKAVTVIISGNRAWATIAADPTRYAGVDGRLSDLSSDRPSHLMPLVSDNWGFSFEWSGQGPMPDTERAELRRMVQNAHDKGRRIRFWATPDQPSSERTALWRELLAAGVDLISTDDLDGLMTFLLDSETSTGQ